MPSFDFASALQQHTTSENTHRAYYRWIDRYLVELSEFVPATGALRVHRMSYLNVAMLQRNITESKLSAWLSKLAEEQQSRQTLDQARASIVTLAELLHDAGHLESQELLAIHRVPVPAIERKSAPERLLTPVEMKNLTSAIIEISSTDNQRIRNAVISTMLFSLALRREELSTLKWGDIGLRNGKPSLKLGDDRLDLPRSVLGALDRWRSAFTGSLAEPPPESPLLRRIWKGGRIAVEGLSPDGVWLIIHQASLHSKLGTVTPDDLRRAVIAQMVAKGASVRDINKLLRHRSTVITERFIAKLTPLRQDSPPGSF